MIPWIAAAAALLIIGIARVWTTANQLTYGRVPLDTSLFFMLGFWGLIAATIGLAVTVGWWASVAAWVAYFVSGGIIPWAVKKWMNMPSFATHEAIKQASEELVRLPLDDPETRVRFETCVDEIMAARGFVRKFAAGEGSTRIEYRRLVPRS